MHRDPLQMSALELAAAIRAGTLCSREVVAAHVAHAQAVNPTINAVVVERYAQALAEAEAADAALAACEDVRELPALHGVPCTIKESFAYAGLPNTSGLLARRGRPAQRHATAVARLREAGAICIGLTNVSELCMWMESDNPVYGRSNNPYDPSRIVGGSSGGEGAIVGAGASPFGLGADIGGSIRMPAFFCGVFGHKSTGGVVPGTGMHPIAENAALRYLTTGPIARRAADLMPLMRILAGPDGEDAGVREVALEDPASVDIAALEVTVVEDNGRIPVDIELVDALERAATALGRRGAKVRRAKIPKLARSFELWSAMLSAASETSFRMLLGEGEAIPLGRELLRWSVGRSSHTLAALGLAALEDLRPFVPDAAGKQALIAEGLALRAELSERLGPRGVLLYPSHPRPAPRHGAPLLRPFDWVYTAIFNVMELPVTQVPAGLSRAGLPLGLQVVGNHDRDHQTIAVALALEEDLGGWVPPSRLLGGAA
ncbi:amidase [Pseudenhygromyxa sp. WMMC2535]|uniref:amidase n=1 Tax=Pseudenhygromyxa sp. WMMC2535 TaxID=2712867 RepID=UPI0031F8D26B